MKRFLLPLLMVAFAFPMAASEIGFSYAEAPYDSLGFRKTEVYDVAIYLPGSSFKDKKVTRVSVPLVKTNPEKFDRDTVGVWLSKTLNVETVDGKKVNAPDIAYYQIIRTDGNEMVDLTLPEGYVIPDEGVYVGYSFDMQVNTTLAELYPIAVGMGCINYDGLYLHSSRTYLNWTSCSEKLKCCSSLTVTLEGEFPEVSLAPINFPKYVYGLPGDSTEVPVSFEYNGLQDVRSVTLEYEIDGKTYTSVRELAEPVKAGLNRKFATTFSLEMPEDRVSEEIDFRVAKVNTNSNEATANSIEAILTVLPYAPAHHGLAEEYTGTWCGWCVFGYACLEYIREKYPEFIAIAWHNNDPMTVTSNYPNVPNGYPTGYYNRDELLNFSGGTVPYEVTDMMKATEKVLTPWDLKVSQEWESDSIIKANVELKSLGVMRDCRCKLAYMFICDGLTSPEWSQNNYIVQNGWKPSENWPQEVNDFCVGEVYGQPAVKGLIFNDVAISASGSKGVMGSIPTELEADQVVSHSFSLDISKIYERGTEVPLVQDKGNVRVVVAVVDEDGKVMNCAKTMSDNQVASVGAVDSSEDGPVEYFNLNGVKVANPSRGIFIRRQGSNTTKVAF